MEIAVRLLRAAPLRFSVFSVVTLLPGTDSVLFFVRHGFVDKGNHGADSDEYERHKDKSQSSREGLPYYKYEYERQDNTDESAHISTLSQAFCTGRSTARWGR